ncbi:hypothetical protein RI129_012089 [Pyrocoelia pectoralis]|uniref:Uncharacterized protein n=1 Tax=Pyrocoelia pectoralis TaxID=417401 RepID=A0AAN7V1Q6_9COLE
MGNNGSRTGHISHQLEAETTWTQSFPRTSHGVYQQHKVLPEKGITKKLRSTNNGEILHAGGTISGRQKTLSLERENKSFKIFRTSSVSSNPSDDPREYGEKPYARYVSNYGGVNRYVAQRLENRNAYREQIKKYGSEPDLRNPSSPSDRNESSRYKGKKKYKAPPPPNHGMLENLNSYRWNEGTSDPIMRRNRLFKTKSELQKRCSSPINVDVRLEEALSEIKNNSSNNNNSRNMLNVQLRNNNRNHDKNNRLSLPEINKASSAPEFQTELKEVVQRLKSTKRHTLEAENQNKYDHKIEEDPKEKIKTLDHSINKVDQVKCRLQLLDLNKTDNRNNILNTYSDRGQPSGKESTPEKKEDRGVDLDKKEQPSKLYYFGMKEPLHNDVDTPDFIDTNISNFATTFQSYKDMYSLRNSSGSDLSSEMEIDESHVSNNGIALQLRPILPKKQLEIPRFSPAAAWKQLSAVESSFTPSIVASEDLPIFMEDRIEKLSRPPPPPAVQTGPRSSYDKSGDSGISGDAGPTGFDDTTDGIDIRNNIELPLVLNRNQGMSWTPQQDLGEDESTTDEDINNHNNQILKSAPVKFTPKPNVFSLSLPRDNQLSSYIRNFGNKKDIDVPNSFSYEGGNWFLSKSAPNSLNNGLNSVEAPKSQKVEEPKPPVTTSNVHNVSRVMYLPESESVYKKNQNVKNDRLRNKEIFRERSRSAESNVNNLSYSKSFENLNLQVQSSDEPENLQDPPIKKNETLKIYKPKRFTFQSTIRQIERKRLAERLSREAEKKEKQRLSELAAMQRVEEEFQRKRAREKASIRQQLRLFSLDDSVWSTVQSNDVKSIPVRPDPDGAVSSTASSPLEPLEKKVTQRVNASEEYQERSHRQRTPSDLSDENVKKTQMTLILSEYRQPQREYKDFRGSPRYLGEYGESHHLKQTTIHPQVTCNMPKVSNSQLEGSSNYRKQFAHGVKTNKSGDSTYSDDSQSINRNSSPKIYRSKRTPISRF